MITLKYFVYLILVTVPTILGYRTIKHNEAAIVLAKPGEPIDIVCQNEVPLVRCGITHPNGTKILFMNLVPGTPSCKFTTDATTSEVGLWTCHLWSPTSPQEIQKTVEVRIAHKFAALDREVAVKQGERVTLSCVSSEGMFPLNECHFTSPEQNKIHVNDETNESNMVLNKYFFPENRSVHRGDCSLTILSVAPSDAGDWACSGWLDLEDRLYTDTMVMKVASVSEALGLDNDESLISVTTFACGSIVFLCMFVLLVYCKQRYHSQFYGKTWGDDDSIENYMIGRIGHSQILVEDPKYFEL